MVDLSFGEGSDSEVQLKIITAEKIDIYIKPDLV